MDWDSIDNMTNEELEIFYDKVNTQAREEYQKESDRRYLEYKNSQT